MEASKTGKANDLSSKGADVHVDAPEEIEQEQMKKDLAAFKALRPYLGRCLSLNHDINNPLAGILGYAEFILTDERPLDEETKANIEQIVECANRIRAQMDALTLLKSSIAGTIDLDDLMAACEEYQKDLPTKTPPVF
jgi:signal transduction histidine kinase